MTPIPGTDPLELIPRTDPLALIMRGRDIVNARKAKEAVSDTPETDSRFRGLAAALPQCRGLFEHAQGLESGRDALAKRVAELEDGIRDAGLERSFYDE